MIRRTILHCFGVIQVTPLVGSERWIEYKAIAAQQNSVKINRVVETESELCKVTMDEKIDLTCHSSIVREEKLLEIMASGEDLWLER